MFCPASFNFRSAVAFPEDTGSGPCEFQTATVPYGGVGADPYIRGGHNSVFVMIGVQQSAVNSGFEVAATHHPTSSWVMNEISTGGLKNRHHQHYVNTGVDQGSQPRGIDGGTGIVVPVVAGQTCVSIWTIGPQDSTLGTTRVYNGTSATNTETIGTGSKTFAITGVVGGGAEYYAVGATDALGTTRVVRLEDSANAANYVEGIVTAYTHNTSITINSSAVGGSGTPTSWKVSCAFGKWRGRSYKHGGILVASADNLEPIYKCDLAAPTGTELPGPDGNANFRILHFLAACESPTAYGALDSTAKIRAYYLQVAAALRAGLRPPLFTGCQWAWDAVDCSVGTTWVDRVSGNVATKKSGVGRPDASKTISLPDVATPAYSGPTLVHPKALVTDSYRAGTSYGYLEASFADETGLAYIEFLDGASVITRIDAPGPYIFNTWTVSAGAHSISCRATYTDGIQLTTGAVSVTGQVSATCDTLEHAFSGLRVAIEADSGVTQSGGTVSAWAGHGPAAATWSATSQPTYNSAAATLANLPTITGNGVAGANIMTSTFDPGDPNVTPIWTWAIARTITFTAGDHWWGTASNTFAVIDTGTGVGQRNGTGGGNVNQVTFTVNTWISLQSYYTASTSDYNRLGSANPITGALAGTSDPGATLALFGRPTNANNANIELHSLVITTAEPSTTEKACGRAYMLHKAFTAAGTAGVKQMFTTFI